MIARRVNHSLVYENYKNAKLKQNKKKQKSRRGQCELVGSGKTATQSGQIADATPDKYTENYK